MTRDPASLRPAQRLVLGAIVLFALAWAVVAGARWLWAWATS